ncbi:MAG: enolase C-terminal domain-like protein [Sandaracinus sp.]
MTYLVTALEARPLRVPLVEPFVIASATMTETRAVEIRAVVTRGGETATGLGEAATLAPVTRESDAQILEAMPTARAALVGTPLETIDALATPLDAVAGAMPVFRAGLESAIVDAITRLEGRSVAAELAGQASAPPTLVTDITLPITRDEAHAVRLAQGWAARGFDTFKVKVGRDREADVRALRAVMAAVPGARVRLDANGGYAAADALALLDALDAERARIECFEQPCGKQDLAGMAEVTARGGVPVVADESVATLADLDAVLAARAAHGINLKLVKQGGLLAAVRLGARAKAEGLRLMAGAMVETRLGLVAMAHVVWALGGVDFVDLDTAFLLEGDPYEGGWAGIDGRRLALAGGPGLGVRRRDER